MKVFFEKDYARVLFDSTNGIIIYEWLTPPTEQDFKEGCEQMIEAVVHFKVGKVVVDTREQGTVASHLLEWMTTDWIKKQQ